MESLPSLCVPTGAEEPGGQVEYLLWRQIRALLSESIICVEEICKGVVHRCLIPADTIHSLHDIADEMEQGRNRNPYPSDASSDDVTNKIIMNIEYRETNRTRREKLRQRRIDLIHSSRTRVGVGTSL